ncbi:MAG: integrase arm-type DNA-binding domain-containing protein, partial [Hyphomonadaceae bacterium]|nr:integrase arm-type DNA-binding domain-containing protein [Hyphomonadaceae bacterium]
MAVNAPTQTVLSRRLTEEMIERLKPPQKGRMEYRDEACRGLRLRVSDKGRKSFSVLFRVQGAGGFGPSDRLLAGRSRRMTLGVWPSLKLSEAREKARAAISAATIGDDPEASRRETIHHRHSNTFGIVLARFIEREIKPSVASWRNVKRSLEIHALDRWHDVPLPDIKRAHVHELLDELIANNRPGAAREVRKHLHRLFGWATDREIITANPIAAMKRGDLQPEEIGRSLSDEEVRAVWQAAGQMGYPFGPFVQLLMLTGQRRNDWALALRSEISSSKRQLEIGAERFKSRRLHVVPLSDQAWEIVEALPVWSGDNPPLFLARNGGGPISGFNTFKSKLDALALTNLRHQTDSPDRQLANYRLHDLRVTCKTRLVDLGVSSEVRDAVVGHAKRGLERVYNKNDYL